jgi:hypothetical protein
VFQHGVCFVAVHYKEAKIAIKQHEGDVFGAIIVDNAGSFSGKRTKAEDVDN